MPPETRGYRIRLFRLFCFAVAWKDQWSEFLNQLTKPCEDVTNDFRRVIDPSLMRSWFQGVLSKSGLENLEDEDVASVNLSS